MTHVRRTEEPGGGGSPLPRDLPDQQVQQGEDPWDIPLPPTARPGTGAAKEEGSPPESAPAEDATEDSVPTEPSG